MATLVKRHVALGHHLSALYSTSDEAYEPERDEEEELLSVSDCNSSYLAERELTSVRYCNSMPSNLSAARAVVRSAT